MNRDKYSERLSLLMANGFEQKRGCITDGRYAFLYHQIDESEMSDKEFDEFITLIKKV